MEIATVMDRVLGRARLDIEDGAVVCPTRGQVDIELCTTCRDWNRFEVDRSGHGTVVCRAWRSGGGYAAQTPAG